MIPYKVRKKKKHMLVWSGLVTKFSAIYKLDGKSETATHKVLLKFITDHGILECIVTDGENLRILVAVGNVCVPNTT